LWLKEGDTNSKKNHGIMSSRLCSNVIIYLFVNEPQMEGVEGIREAVFNHFASHFQLGTSNCPTIENLSFNSLIFFLQSGELVKPFSLEEIK
jgi:hypothetical protein